MKTKDTFSVAIPDPIYMLILMLKHSSYLDDQSLNESLVQLILPSNFLLSAYGFKM